MFGQQPWPATASRMMIADMPSFRTLVVPTIALSICLQIPCLLTVAGDATVHLAVADKFAHGQPFEYNGHGDIVVASTSPFWTLMLTGFLQMSMRYAPVLLKITCLLFFVLVAFLLNDLASRHWKLSDPARWGLLALWLTSPTILVNTLGGMENVITAFQLLLLYTLLRRPLLDSSLRYRLGIGMLLGWALLTRPDTAFFSGLLVLCSLVPELWGRKSPRAVIQGLAHLLVVAGMALAIVAPWFAFQYAQVGQLVTDSSVARLLVGRRTSIMIGGGLYYHPRLFLVLTIAFAPIAAGVLVAAARLVRDVYRAPGRFLVDREWVWRSGAPMILVLCGFAFYSFVFGALHAGRYFLPLLPYFFYLGIRTADELLPRLPSAARLAIVAASVAYLFSVSAYDYSRRLQDETLAFNLPAIMAAPFNREQFTDRLLTDLGVPGSRSVKFAVTEVQIRYLLDDRVEILSLDGRSSGLVLTFADRRTGIPDFPRYLEATHPDFLELGQWCTPYTGLQYYLIPAPKASNLLCDWERRVSKMHPGEGFEWKGRWVQVVQPGIVQITWSAPDVARLVLPAREQHWDCGRRGTVCIFGAKGLGNPSLESVEM